MMQMKYEAWVYYVAGRERFYRCSEPMTRKQCTSFRRELKDRPDVVILFWPISTQTPKFLRKHIKDMPEVKQ
jgi:hypothetical protein